MAAFDIDWIVKLQSNTLPPDCTHTWAYRLCTLLLYGAGMAVLQIFPVSLGVLLCHLWGVPVGGSLVLLSVNITLTGSFLVLIFGLARPL